MGSLHGLTVSRLAASADNEEPCSTPVYPAGPCATVLPVPDPTKPISPEARALKFVESLGVHGTYNDAVEILATSAGSVETLLAHRAARRTLQEMHDDREHELMDEERPKHESHAAFERAMKEIVHKDDGLRQMRTNIRKVTEDIERVEAELELGRHALRVAEARMIELGGLMTFLASVKVSASKPTPDQ